MRRNRFNYDRLILTLAGRNVHFFFEKMLFKKLFKKTNGSFSFVQNGGFYAYFLKKPYPNMEYRKKVCSVI